MKNSGVYCDIMPTTRVYITRGNISGSSLSPSESSMSPWGPG